MVWKVIRTTILVIIYVFVLVYAEIRSYIVTYVLGKLAIRDLNNRAIEELLLVNLAKTITRDDEEPYFFINVEQHRL